MRHLHDDDIDAIGLLLEERILTRIQEMENNIMAAIDDANTALTNLQTSATTIVDKLGQVNQDPAISTLATGIQAVADQLTNAVTPPAPA